MESSNWAPAHSDALRKHFAMGMSYAEIARAINAEFRTHYSRCATIGRARRIGLAEARWLERAASMPLRAPSHSSNLYKLIKSQEALAKWLARPAHCQELPPLRRAAVVPRRLSLPELEAGDCRYPYGGDEEGEPISFCGHPRRRGSSYCAAHFHLTRNPGAAPERVANTAVLKVIDAARTARPRMYLKLSLQGSN
jgi:GcrA cell cycle regulator